MARGVIVDSICLVSLDNFCAHFLTMNKLLKSDQVFLPDELLVRLSKQCLARCVCYSKTCVTLHYYVVEPPLGKFT
jgi:hypothetical protein